VNLAVQAGGLAALFVSRSAGSEMVTEIRPFGPLETLHFRKRFRMWRCEWPSTTYLARQMTVGSALRHAISSTCLT
jgi:hypothetical protein